MKPDLRHEAAAGDGAVCGIDEAGRGPWAGPVVAAAVILDAALMPEGIDDSKRLTPRRRGLLAGLIRQTARTGTGLASVAEIDSLGIVPATDLAMARAVAALDTPPVHALVDGRHLPKDLGCPATTIIKGDQQSLSIAAASIIAKVTRDQMMVALSQQFPGYSWETNKGYGTKAHQSGLEKLGPTPHHRHSFRPIHKILYKEI